MEGKKRNQNNRKEADRIRKSWNTLLGYEFAYGFGRQDSFGV